MILLPAHSSDFQLETKWGLGLQNLSDMPDMNVFNFGLVSKIHQLLSIKY